MTSQVLALKEYQSPLGEVPNELDGFQSSKRSSFSTFSVTDNLTDDDAVMGNPNAPVTIVEFGDLQCPACKMAHPGLRQAISEFPGKINFVFRHYPLPQHKNSVAGAKAVEAANIQGKVWEMFDKLYDAQEEWAESNNPIDIYKKYAAELKMDGEKLASDMNNPSIQEKVNNDIADGNALGVSSTPTLFFNNELYKGGVRYEDLKAEIESKTK